MRDLGRNQGGGAKGSSNIPFQQQLRAGAFAGLAQVGPDKTHCPHFVRVLMQTGPNQRLGQVQKGLILLGQIGRGWCPSHPWTVLKTTVPGRVPGVRIPLPPPNHSTGIAIDSTVPMLGTVRGTANDRKKL